MILSSIKGTNRFANLEKYLYAIIYKEAMYCLSWKENNKCLICHKQQPLLTFKIILYVGLCYF
jgi:hypothetical protein